MTQPVGPSDFFALEAGECLNRLEALLGGRDAPGGDEFVRQVRLLRGAALMANRQPIAQAAAVFEALARAVRDRERTWDDATRELALQAVDDFRALVRRVPAWTDADTTRAREVGAGLDRALGRTAGHGAPPPGDLGTGVRAFVAREGALIASALDRAARALRSTPDAHEPLHAVLRRMQSLRGLAELSELAPLPDILDGVELAVSDLTRQFAPPPDVHEVIEAAAHALTRVCRDVTESERPVADAPEARRFTDLLLRAFADERDVVPIEALFRADDPAPYVVAGSPQGAAPLGELELTSHGEHLGQAADRVEQARSATERDLRLFTLLAPLRALGRAAPDQAGEAVGAFAHEARARIADGRASRDPVRFAAALRGAGVLLRGAAEARDGRAVVSAWTGCIAALRQVGEGAPAVAAPPPAAELPIVAIETLLYDGEPVPGRAPAPRAAEPPPTAAVAAEAVVPIETLVTAAPASVAEGPDESRGDLEGSFARYHRLVEEGATLPPSLEAFLAGTPAETPVVPIAELVAPEPVPPATAPEPAPPPIALPAVAERVPAPPIPVEVPAPAAVPEPEPVPIAELCYRGTSAMQRVLALRNELRARLDGPLAAADVRALLDELLDLIPAASARD